MSGSDGYQVDLGEVYDYLGGKTVKVTDLSGLVCGGVRDMGGSTAGLPPIAKPAEIALREAFRFLEQAMRSVTALFETTADNVDKSMQRYRAVSDDGAARLDAVLPAPAGTNPHDFFGSHERQAGANVAEIGIRQHFDPSAVHLVPGDMLTTAGGRLLVVGQEGRFYENGSPVAPPAGEEVRMYRRMTS